MRSGSGACGGEDEDPGLLQKTDCFKLKYCWCADTRRLPPPPPFGRYSQKLGEKKKIVQAARFVNKSAEGNFLLALIALALVSGVLPKHAHGARKILQAQSGKINHYNNLFDHFRGLTFASFTYFTFLHV